MKRVFIHALQHRHYAFLERLCQSHFTRMKALLNEDILITLDLDLLLWLHRRYLLSPRDLHRYGHGKKGYLAWKLKHTLGCRLVTYSR